MPYFGKDSRNNLSGVHPLLVLVAHHVIEFFDYSVLSGVRSAEEQSALYKDGKSQRDGYEKKSEHQPKEDGYGYAIDVAPYPIDWDDHRRFYALYGAFLAIGHVVLQGSGYSLRFGADWDSDGEFDDQKFHDLGHIELIKE